MAMFDRGTPDRPLVVDEWDAGLGWIPHPDEAARRASHALLGDDGVWLFDPLDAPGIDPLISRLGDVAGVAVLSNYHRRDAAVFADRYDVPVTIPAWFDEVADAVDAPVERTADTIGDSGFTLRRVDPLPTWREAVAWREDDATLYAADVLSGLPQYCVADEQLAPYLFLRLFPPHAVFADLTPERVICGHGTGVFDDAPAALEDGLQHARRGLPRALFENGPEQLRTLYGALTA